ncbi:GGDEF domain-containing protein [Paraferrimonas sp. SM1919]|uniref:GGDEF domain-containing protein n=1 Tax=Paraferrimonas sp. SM1919 TaxID=2662263 RepID=UPI0013D3AB9C|nr:GGDEF domain-containing protein [Paraferrimonas sp. SM1919]
MHQNKRIEKFYQQYQQLLSFSNISWWLMDLENEPNVFYCNPTMCETFALDPSKLKHSVDDSCPIAGDYNANIKIKNTKKAQQIYDDYQNLCAGKIIEYNNNFPYYRSDLDRTFYFKSQAKALLKDDNNRAQVLFGIIEPEVVSAELYQKATTDSLTGLKNRREFDTKLDFFINLAYEEKHPLTLIMLDIDNFKQYNDTFGHYAGDECLIKTANIIKANCIRHSFMPFRYGGEEFAIIVYDNAQKALEVANKIRLKLENKQFIINDLEIIVTMSIGIYSLNPESHTTNRMVIEKADRALYKAKELGKNRVVEY